MPQVTYVYIFASRSRCLQVGTTSDLRRRVWERSIGTAAGPAARGRARRLVYYEVVGGPDAALARAREIVAWDRARRIALIEAGNPGWSDLAAGWFTWVAGERAERVPDRPGALRLMR